MSSPAALVRTASVADYLELTKPRITVMVVFTALVGFVMGSRAGIPLVGLSTVLVGVALVASGASALPPPRTRPGPTSREESPSQGRVLEAASDYSRAIFALAQRQPRAERLSSHNTERVPGNLDASRGSDQSMTLQPHLPPPVARRARDRSVLTERHPGGDLAVKRGAHS